MIDIDRTIEKIDELIEKSCYIIDVLPEQVPADSKGKFFEVENYLLNDFKQNGLLTKFSNILLKLMCYYSISILWDCWIEEPTPEMVVNIICEILENHSGTVYILFSNEDALLTFEWDCLHMSIYNPDEDMKRILDKLAISEGLFFWNKVDL